MKLHVVAIVTNNCEIYVYILVQRKIQGDMYLVQ